MLAIDDHGRGTLSGFSQPVPSLCGQLIGGAHGQCSKSPRSFLTNHLQQGDPKVLQTRETAWPEAKDTLERSETGGWFSEGILDIICPQKIMAPVGLVVVTVGAEEVCKFLIQSLYLANGLGVIS